MVSERSKAMGIAIVSGVVVGIVVAITGRLFTVNGPATIGAVRGATAAVVAATAVALRRRHQ